MERKNTGATIAVCCILLALVVGFAFFSLYGGSVGSSSSSFSLNGTHADGSLSVMTEFDFQYVSMNKQRKTVQVELNEHTAITVQNYTSTGECRLILSKNAKEIWRGELQDGVSWSALVQEPAVYDLTLEAEEGEGHGTVKLIP